MNTFFRGASANVDGPKNSASSTDEYFDDQSSETLLQNMTATATNDVVVGDTKENRWFPIDRANRVLIGAYPRNLKEIEYLILTCGVRCFVNLTADKSYESWLPFMSAAAAAAKPEFLYRPMLRRDEISDDGKIINLCREIAKWLEANSKERRIYIHSELGYGRAGVIGTILTGDFECLQTNQAVAAIEMRRKMHRTVDYEQEHRVPIIETNAQMQQVFRVLGNPQISAEEEEDQEGIRFIAKGNARKTKEQEEKEKDVADDVGGEAENDVGGFAPLESHENSSTASLLAKQEQERVAKGLLNFKEMEYVPLPDRGEQSWRIDADRWISARKAARKKQITELSQKITASTNTKKTK